MPPESIIQTHGLTKRFGDLLAVDHVTFAVLEGESFAVLGANGSGKSTVIKVLTTRRLRWPAARSQ